MSGVKTEIDGFSGHQIHPGHGRLHIREDKHMMAFEGRKAYRMWSRKRNPRKIAWTEHYRHDHKKSVADMEVKSQRIVRKKVQRGYAGVQLNANAQQAQVVKKRVANANAKKPTKKAAK